MSKEEKLRKIEELDQKLVTLREQRDKLAAEMKEWAEKRDKFNSEFKRLKAEAAELKKIRDEINTKVKELKQQRNQMIAEIAQKNRELKCLRDQIKVLIMKKPPESVNALQREIEAIEWKIQTTPLSLQEEKQLVEKVKRLEVQLKIHRKIEELNQKKLELTTDLKALEARAKSLHDRIVNEAERSQQIHEEMIKKLEEAKRLKVEAGVFHKFFLQAREKVNPVKEEIKKILEEMRKLREEVAAEALEEKRRSEESLLDNIAKTAMEKLKRGEKLTWEEFKILTEKGLA